jgi:hypothetical protein
MRLLWCLGVMALLFFAGCKSGTIETVPDNEPASDPTISLLYRQNFLDKTYLAFLGRYANDIEKQEGLAILDQNNCSIENRATLIQTLQNSEDYRIYLGQLEANILLNYASDGDVQWTLNYITELSQDGTNPAVQAEFLILLDEMNHLISVAEAYKNGNSDLVTLHKALTSNLLYYWEAGTKNDWPERSFSYFMLRLPTYQEDDRAKEMLNGFEATLFGKTGSSFDDLKEIFFSSDEYYEGQVRHHYTRLLRRLPTPEELAQQTTIFANDKDVAQVQKRIMLTAEFLTK